MRACQICAKELRPGDMVTPIRERPPTQEEAVAMARVRPITTEMRLAGCGLACVACCPPEWRFINHQDARLGIHAPGEDE